MFKFHHGLLPAVFSEFFVQNNQVHSHNTRQAEHMHVPLLKCNPASLSLRKLGVRSYNHFRGVLNIDCTEVTYKYNLKTYILQNGISYVLN